MKGMQLAKAYYLEYGLPMLQEQFPQILPHIAVGLFGSGSECYGYDDEISQDHDFEPGFCIFLPDESVVDERTAFLLERAYSRLPKEFRGFKRSVLSPVGGNRHGVFRAAEYFMQHAGTPDGQLTVREWIETPDYVLAEATNGEVFRDDDNLINPIRAKLMDMPEDIRMKKLAGNILIMNQAGQYNYPRTLLRQDAGAAQLTINEYVNAAIKAVYLLNRRYRPYYKWTFQGLRQLDRLSETAEQFAYLLNTGNTDEQAKAKTSVMEDINAQIIAELLDQQLIDIRQTDLEMCAYQINNQIKDVNIRNLDILIGV